MIPFSNIDIYDLTIPKETREAAEFYQKMDWEGGLDGLMSYGGVDFFPPEVREQARQYEQAKETLKDSLRDWAADRGVEY